jgi:uncharacterized protein
MSMYAASVPQMKKMLQNLDKWIEMAVANAKTRGFDANVLLQMRLAPDQYPFVRQVQSSCDTAKFTAARLTGKEAPKHPDTETTIEELHARIKAVVTYLDTFSEKDFAGASERHIDLPFAQGKWMPGNEYLNELQIPNFYFHATTAYAILRHNGVPLGKMDYIGRANMRDK